MPPKAASKNGSPVQKPCRADQVRNPKTKRCVLKSGAIGKALAAGKSPPKRKKASPKASPKGANALRQALVDADEFPYRNGDGYKVIKTPQTTRVVFFKYEQPFLERVRSSSRTSRKISKSI